MLSESFGKKVIGILARPTEDFENDKQVAVMDDYRRAVVKKGCIPYIICPRACPKSRRITFNPYF